MSPQSIASCRTLSVSYHLALHGYWAHLFNKECRVSSLADQTLVMEVIPDKSAVDNLNDTQERPPSLRMVASHTIIEQFLMRALLTVWWSFIRLSRDGEAVPHMLFQFDLVTHDLRSTRGVTRNWFGDARSNPVTTKASVNINRIRNEDRRFPTR